MIMTTNNAKSREERQNRGIERIKGSIIRRIQGILIKRDQGPTMGELRGPTMGVFRGTTMKVFRRPTITGSRALYTLEWFRELALGGQRDSSGQVTHMRRSKGPTSAQGAHIRRPRSPIMSSNPHQVKGPKSGQEGPHEEVKGAHMNRSMGPTP